MRVKIEITPEIIAESQARVSNLEASVCRVCPTAIAISRVLHDTCQVQVGYDAFSIRNGLMDDKYDYAGSPCFRGSLPEHITQQIHNLRYGRDMTIFQPCSFELDVPQEYLK